MQHTNYSKNIYVLYDLLEDLFALFRFLTLFLVYCNWGNNYVKIILKTQKNILMRNAINHYTLDTV